MFHERILVSLLAAYFLSACGGSSTQAPAPVPPPPSPSVLEAPTVINLYPDGSSSDGTRLFVFVTAVGSVTFNAPLPLAFDTGSSGMTLFAPNAFPSMATACSVAVPTGCGFTFPPGQHSITFDNVTVTDVRATRCYGGASGHAQTGNIGFATVTFGDAAGVLTTGVMPVLFFYKITANSANPNQCDDSGAVVNVPPQQGWFGVNAQADGVVVGGILATSSSPSCTNGGQVTCIVASVLDYLQYAGGMDAGFLLTHQALQLCSIDSGTCMAAPMLTLGLTPTQTAGFESMALNCSSAPSLEGLPDCSANIPAAGVTVSAADGSNATTYAGTPTLFDSGTPDMILAPPSGVTVPTGAGTNVIADDQKVLITLTNGYDFSYSTALDGVDETVVNATAGGRNIVGIGFFQNHDFYIDFTAGSEGWR